MEPATTHSPPETDALRHIRQEIDRLDQEILELMARRFDFAQATLSVKARLGLGPVDTRREAEVVRRAASHARERGLHPELVRDIFWRLIELSKASKVEKTP
ncbi:MAG TPA: chorismate mutase [Longimicrobiales bacterium]|nr:chorismate mutase [Longimicrobiales bacterium]